MKNRNKKFFGRLFDKAVQWVAEQLLESIPVVGTFFKIAKFAFA